jgi:Ca-activated chloride channel family protein
MIHFAWPWLFLALPLPWFIRRFTPAVNNAQQAALKVPFLDDFNIVQSQQVAQARYLRHRLIRLTRGYRRFVIVSV